MPAWHWLFSQTTPDFFIFNSSVMAKDPAFLFYSSDFISGTVIMSDEEVGQYIRLLCHQHQSGHFSELAMQKLCNGNATALIRDKFCIDENGLFFNKRLDAEVVRRSEFAQKQRQKAIDRWEKVGNATALPIETITDTVNENETVTKSKKNGSAEKFNPLSLIPEKWNGDLFLAEWDDYMISRKKKKWACGDKVLSIRINQLRTLSGDDWGKALAMLQKSTERGYAEFFAPDQPKNGKEAKSIYEPGYYDKA